MSAYQEEQMQDIEFQGFLDFLCDSAEVPSEDDSITESEDQEQEVET